MTGSSTGTSAGSVAAGAASGVASGIDAAQRDAFIAFVLALADDKLMIGTRNSDWTGLAPILEEDIAFSSLAQDEMAHASALYAYIAPLAGRTADQLAFGREPEAYRCADLCVLSDAFDWALALARHFLFSHYQTLVLARCGRSVQKDFSSLAKRLHAEQRVHVRHADDWIRRLGAGTPDAQGRLQHALDTLMPLAAALFEPVPGQDGLVSAGLYPGDDAAMFAEWSDDVRGVLKEAGLTMSPAMPQAPWNASQAAGRRGVHHPALAELLDEMCEVYRQEPDAKW
ncbi:MAG: phenylacetate-CoA oxygenase subunit PaaC [Phycisphaerales bacterium]|nr:phenylacetate-CoA oxygenase subunit PaaC [Phycisphaerales bacterium]